MNQSIRKCVGILMKQDLINAVLAGRKTVTRRLLTLPDQRRFEGMPIEALKKANFAYSSAGLSPYGRDSDLLYIKEAIKPIGGRSSECVVQVEYKDGDKRTITVSADSSLLGGTQSWLSPMFMPKAAARYFLQIYTVTIENLQDISDDDAIAEGYDQGSAQLPRDWFKEVINKINGPTTWESNPLVWRIKFALVEAQIAKDLLANKE
jgi:hypothetical protein